MIIHLIHRSHLIILRLIVDEMAVVQHCKDEVRLQQCANTIALMARKLSKDPKVRLLAYKTF